MCDEVTLKLDYFHMTKRKTSNHSLDDLVQFIHFLEKQEADNQHDGDGDRFQN